MASITIRTFCFLALFASTDWAAAEPTPDQVAAIKSNCRSDFLSNCRGVPRGGSEAMQCLKNNFASVSPGCQQALKPLMAAAPPKTPAPAPAVTKPEPALAPEPAPAKTTAPAAEPKPDTAATPPPSAPASEPAPKTAAKPPAKEAPPAPAAKAKEPAADTPKAAATPPVAAPAAPEAAPVIVGRIPPRQKLMIRRNCRQDLETHCAGVDYGEGRQLQCLFSKKTSLSADCQGALAKLTR